MHPGGHLLRVAHGERPLPAEHPAARPRPGRHLRHEPGEGDPIIHMEIFVRRIKNSDVRQ